MKKIALILLVVSACKSVKVERTVEYRDTTITVAADSAKILLRFIPCPDGTMPQVEGTDAKQGRKTSIKAKQNGSTVEVRAEVAPEQVKTQVKKIVTTNQRQRCPEHSHDKFYFVILFLLFTNICTYLLRINIPKS